MATRQFDYAAIQEIYSNMNKTIGTAADADSIAGILNNLDREVQEYIGVCDEAIYGPLANQLLLDWFNTASNFPNFVENFNNWSQLVAMSGGDYAQFESDVAGFRELNPLGTYSGEATSNFIETGKYSAYTKEDIDTMSNSVLALYAEVGDAYFVDTNMVEYEKMRKTMDIVMFGIQGVTTILSIIPAAKLIGTGGKVAGTAAKTTATTGAKAIGSTSVKALTGGAAAKTGTGVMSKLAGKIVPKVTAAGAKIAGVARAAATGVANFGKKIGSKVSSSAIVKSAKSLVTKIAKPIKAAGAKISTGFKSVVGKVSAKGTGATASTAFKTVTGKTAGLTDDVLKEATKIVNKQTVKTTLNGKTYSTVAELADDFAKGSINYKDFTKGFNAMINHSPMDNVTKFAVRDYMVHKATTDVAFQNALRVELSQAAPELALQNTLKAGTSQTIPQLTTEVGTKEIITTATVKDVVEIASPAARVKGLRTVLYELGLQGVQEVSQNTFTAPAEIINSGIAA